MLGAARQYLWKRPCEGQLLLTSTDRPLPFLSAGQQFSYKSSPRSPVTKRCLLFSMSATGMLFSTGTSKVMKSFAIFQTKKNS